MNVEIFSLCNYSFVNKATLSIIDSIDAIFSAQVPATHILFFVVAKVRFEESEFGEHSFRITMENPDGDMIFDISDRVQAKPDFSTDSAAVNISVQMDAMEFHVFGRYSVSLFIDDSRINTLPLYLIKLKNE